MTDYKITASSELMQNYRQAQVMAPENDMKAVQTASGDALLFSIGTNAEFYVTHQHPGTKTGWAKHQLNDSTTGDNSKLFAVAQKADGSIPLALATTSEGSDTLFLSLGNSDSDTSWVTSPSWVSYPYDNPNETRKTVVVTAIYISEAQEGQYIVVDLLRDPTQATGPITRYYIDPTKADGYAWKQHDLAIDIDAGTYRSCLGQSAGGGAYAVNGIYTSGTVNGTAQFVYTPLYNVFDPSVAPNPAKLSLPGNAVPDAMAANWKSDGTTDLFVTSGDGLYCFTADNQKSDAVAQLLFQNDVFTGTRKLFAYTAEDRVVVWGLNGDDQVFYTSCPVDRITVSPAQWTPPLPIMSGVEQMSPYLNAANNANTFFAQTGENKLAISVKSPSTTLWTRHDVTLPPATPNAPAESFYSYTTQIQVNTDTDQPAANVSTKISSDSVVNVYINGLYYVLDPTGVDVETDASGAITVVQPVDNLSCAVLTITAGSSTVTQNPMTKPFQKATALTSVSALQGATITSQDGSTRPLIQAGTSTGALQQVADSNSQITQAYTSLDKKTSAPAADLALATAPVSTVSDLSLSGNIFVDAGDLFSWLGHEIESGVEHVIHLIEDAAKDVWSVIVTIAGKTYQAVLNTVNAVVNAVEWIYNAIKTAITDLLDFLEFLFDIADMKRTKDVVKNLLKLFLQNEVSQISTYKADFNRLVGGLEKDVNKWAGLNDWSGLGPSATAPTNKASTPGAHSSAPGTLLSNHYRDNASQTSFTTSPTSPTSPESTIKTLFDALEQEGEVIGGGIEELQTIASHITTTSLEDVLKQLVAVLTDAVLGSAEVVVDALFDILQNMAQTAVDALDTPIYIPVISDILKIFGVSEFSLLDVICWIVAVPTTLVYKLAEEKPPFPDDSTTTFLIEATDFDQVVDAFENIGQPAPQSLSAAALPQIQLSPAVAAAVFTVGHAVSGVATLLAALVSSLEAAEESGDNEFAIASAVVGVVGAGSLAVANKLVPKYPIQNTVVSDFSSLVTGVSILGKIMFSGPAQEKFKTSSSIKLNKLAVDDARGVGAVVQAVLVVPALFCTVWHFVELSKDPAGADRSDAIIDTTSEVTGDVAKVAYAIAVNTEGEPKAIAIGVMAVADVCTAGLQIAESAVT